MPTILGQGEEPGKEEPIVVASIIEVSCEARARNELVYDLDKIDGHEFEDAMAEVFRRMGYHTERGKLSNDHGRDIILRRAERLVVVECKHQKSAVGRPIVQKLHSATITYPNATDGFVLTTGCFAPSALEYVQELNVKSNIKFELWDYERLVREAHEVGVYFVASLHGTNIFFYVPWRPDSEIRCLLQTRHLSRIRSAPRTAVDAICITKSHHEIVPAVLVDYSVDKQFQTQVGTIHYARERGCRIHGTHGIGILPGEEQFWIQSRPVLVRDSELDGKRVPTYFGEPTEPLIENTRNGTAQRLSRRVRYQGGNNQAYEKLCEVNPDDVDVQTKQVLYGRWRIDLQAGPKRYEVHLADDVARDPGIVTSTGFCAGNEGFVLANGFLCNDCGLIAPKDGDKSGLACETCGRTLCQAHGWTWPAPLFRHSTRLCSTCYRSRRRHSAEFDVNPVLYSYWLSLLLACIPGVPLLLGKRYGLGILVLLLLLCSLVASVYRYPEPIILVVCSSVSWSFHWTSRIRRHNQNVTRLATYLPEWAAR